MKAPSYCLVSLVDCFLMIGICIELATWPLRSSLHNRSVTLESSEQYKHKH